MNVFTSLLRCKNQKKLVFLDQAIVSGSNFILGIFLARLLGVAGYGQFALVWLVVLFLNSLQIAYIISPMLTLGSKKSPATLDKYLNATLYLELLALIGAGIGLYLLLSIFSFLKEDLLKGIGKWEIILIALAFLFQDFIRKYYIIKDDFYKLLGVDLIAYLGQIAGVGYLVMLGEVMISDVLLITAFSFVLSSFLGLLGFVRVKLSRGYCKLIFLKNNNYSKWLVLTSMLQWGSGNFYVVAASLILGSWSVGVIRVVQNTAGVLNVVFLSLESLLPVVFSKMYKAAEWKEINLFLRKSVCVGGCVGIVCLVVSIFFAKSFLAWLYGQEYGEYGYVLVLYIGVYFCIYISLLLRIMVRTIEETKQLFVANFGIFLVNIVLVYPMLTLFKLDGVLAGIILSHVMYIVFLTLKLNKCGMRIIAR